MRGVEAAREDEQERRAEEHFRERGRPLATVEARRNARAEEGFGVHAGPGEEVQEAHRAGGAAAIRVEREPLEGEEDREGEEPHESPGGQISTRDDCGGGEEQEREISSGAHSLSAEYRAEGARGSLI